MGKKRDKEYVRAEAKRVRMAVEAELQRWHGDATNEIGNATRKADSCYRALDKIMRLYRRIESNRSDTMRGLVVKCLLNL